MKNRLKLTKLLNYLSVPVFWNTVYKAILKRRSFSLTAQRIKIKKVDTSKNTNKAFFCEKNTNVYYNCDLKKWRDELRKFRLFNHRSHQGHGSLYSIHPHAAAAAAVSANQMMIQSVLARRICNDIKDAQLYFPLGHRINLLAWLAYCRGIS